MHYQNNSIKKKILFLFLLIINYSYAQEIEKDSIKTTNLKEVLVVSKNPISVKFSVTKVEKLDIYFNPVSNGDALKAITILPSSTNVDETANPTLRGGSADRTRVYINGSPVLNPVRNGQDNGLGNFSILNTEIIDKQYVYASNPPLTYGNSSAGLVEIETNKKLNLSNIQISSALSNIGFMINKNIGKKMFVQIYGNNQFSDLFIKLNKEDLPYLNDFNSQDIGLNCHINIGENLTFNTFSYFINEFYSGKNYYLNFLDNSEASQKRFFTINNLDYTKGKSKIRFSSLFDNSVKDYSYGIIDSKTISNNCFITLSHKYRFLNNLTLQYGFDNYNSKYNYNEIRPLYFFSLLNDAPKYYNKEIINFNYSEVFLYIDYKLNSDFGISTSFRKNIFNNNNLDNFLSYQASSFYNINDKNRLILSLGKYNSYSTPNYFYHNISLLSSNQIALDYYLEKKKYSFSSAIYFKKDYGDNNSNLLYRFSEIRNSGIEFTLNYNINKNFSFGISNTFLEQKGYINNTKYKTANNLKYFIKTQISYINPKLFTCSLSLNTRPGNNFTQVNNSLFNNDANDYEPFFEITNNSTFNNYFKIDFTINKVFNIKDNSLITFLSINNIFNNKNNSSIYYNNDYTVPTYTNYQQRIIYFGLQFRFNKMFNKK